MKRAVLRSVGVGALTIAAIGLAALVRTTVFCPQRRNVRAIDGSEVILANGFRVARPGDALLACRVTHCVGPFCHEDQECMCAPATIPVDRAASLIGGTCVVDRPRPLLSDDRGACRHARCDEHLGQ